jgi:hypothetical protein
MPDRSARAKGSFLLEQAVDFFSVRSPAQYGSAADASEEES